MLHGKPVASKSFSIAPGTARIRTLKDSAPDCELRTLRWITSDD